jgi:hypothetical protein
MMLIQETLQQVVEMRNVGRGKQVELHQEIAKRRLRTSAPLLVGLGELLGIDQPRLQGESAEQQLVVDVHVDRPLGSFGPRATPARGELRILQVGVARRKSHLNACREGFGERPPFRADAERRLGA